MRKQLALWILSTLVVVVWLTAANATPPTTVSGFTRIGQGGFGDSANSYSWTVYWFKGNLYVGTNRHHLHSMFEALSFMPGSPIDPSTLPPSLIPAPPPFTSWFTPGWADAFQAEIWRYNKLGQWERVLQSGVMGPIPLPPPFPPGAQGMAPVAYGYRGLKEFNGYLYACGIGTWMPPMANNTILRSASGDNGTWENVSGTIAATTNIRAITTWNGKIYVAASVPQGGAVVFGSADPKNVGWTQLSLPGFGIPANSEIYDLAVFNNHLYASTINLVTGFEVWKTKGIDDGAGHYVWTRVIRNGFGDTWNQYGMSMTAFKNYLYVGTAVGIGMVMKINPSTGQPEPVGTRAFEVIRIDKADKATLIVGNKDASDPIDGGPVPRNPLSKMSAGFNNPLNVYAWNVSVYEGCLYVGTFDWTTFIIGLLEQNPESFYYLLQFYGISLPQEMADLIASPGGIALMKKLFAGGDLWKSCDGVKWSPVTLNGFNNSYNYGIREVVPVGSPYYPALAIGTANPFTGQPGGGCEVWLKGRLPGH